MRCMERRLWILGLACWPLAHLVAQEEPRPRHKVSAAELYEALATRFPVRMGMGGLLEVQVSAPGLLLLPARNRLGATLLAEIGGQRVRPLQSAEMDIVFGLRYEASDQTLRARDAEILGLRWPGLPPEGAEALQRVLPGIAREAMRELVLHRFTARELALPDTMGFEPDTLTVLDDGLEIRFRPKAR